MPDMSPKKTPMPSQAPDVRNKNFSEVALAIPVRWPWVKPNAA